MTFTANPCFISAPPYPTRLHSKLEVISNHSSNLKAMDPTLIPSQETRRCECFDLHKELIPYYEAWNWQKSVIRKRHILVELDEDHSDTIIVLQHPSVYTLGTGSSKEYLKFDTNNAPYDIYQTERGGEVTYHGPGQLVMYPIINLRYHKMDLHWYLRALEEVVIRVLSSTFSIKASRLKGFTGVWVGTDMGMHLTRGYEDTTRTFRISRILIRVQVPTYTLEHRDTVPLTQLSRYLSIVNNHNIWECLGMFCTKVLWCRSREKMMIHSISLLPTNDGFNREWSNAMRVQQCRTPYRSSLERKPLAPSYQPKQRRNNTSMSVHTIESSSSSSFGGHSMRPQPQRSILVESLRGPNNSTILAWFEGRHYKMLLPHPTQTHQPGRLTYISHGAGMSTPPNNSTPKSS